ncbi:4Fe-4S binding protein [Nostoc sp. FACHB-87]|uniref:circadian clock protein LdpA n=1 Tax=Nostocaceae TaxID=1162 RepID=UPI001687C9AB|nr:MULTISPECIES: LdpA C-terminal domain-containing domain [Nostocaceae]MBD2457957.1 4Fe-4S binding protein [Nostoc sp. FACHB-87]MBD2479126.1 4Fe-4S binding protein [Anabaena sp. FACHB-83]
MTDLFAPLHSLENGCWFKLICGASYQHLPAVRSLTLAYTLAGADCIDVAADPAVIAAAKAGLQAAKNLTKAAQERGFDYQGGSPLLMVSLNDGEDPHFRKAEFDAVHCPSDCLRPCERVCPAQAIAFNRKPDNFSGVESQKCYGCGRCIPLCPYDIIYTRSYISTPEAIAPMVISTGVNAVEIHTQVGRLVEFQKLWQAISPWAEQLQLLAISCPDGDGMIDYLKAIYELITPRPRTLIWQTDGRPMSGDIGDGTTTAAVKLGQKVLAANLPGYVQLAGGTNSYTVAKLKAMGLLKRAGVQECKGTGVKENSSPLSSPSPLSSSASIAGVAYGSYARVLLSPILEQLENKEVNYASVQGNVHLESEPDLLWEAVGLAYSLVSQIKSQQER